MTQQQLLEEVRRHIPSVTKEQLDGEILAANLTAEKVIASTALLGSIVGRLRKSTPGGMTIATLPNPIAAHAPKFQPKPKTEVTEKAIDEPVSELGYRDWSKFKTKDLANLTDEELDFFKAYREADLKRKNKINEILGLEAENLDIEAANLQAITQVQTADRVLETDRAASEYAQTSGEKLIELARAAGKAASEDQFNRDCAALNQTIEVGKQTPTQGEIGLAQAQGLRARRMNALVGIQNQWEQKIQPMQLAGADSSVVTIDA